MFLPFKRVRVWETEVKISGFVKQMPVWHLMSISAATSVSAIPSLPLTRSTLGLAGRRREVRLSAALSACLGWGRINLPATCRTRSPSSALCLLPTNPRETGKKAIRVMNRLPTAGVNPVTAGDPFYPQSAASILPRLVLHVLRVAPSFSSRFLFWSLVLWPRGRFRESRAIR